MVVASDIKTWSRNSAPSRYWMFFRNYVMIMMSWTQCKRVKSERMLCDAVRSKQQCYLVSWLEHVLCVQNKTCNFVLPLSILTEVINLLNGIWRHHLLSNKVGQNSCSLILKKNHCTFSVICVRFMYKYLALCHFPPFLILRCLSFFKDISCSYCLFTSMKHGKLIFIVNSIANVASACWL